MNQKTARKIRHHLRQAEEGQKVTAHAYYELEKRRKVLTEIVTDDAGNPVIDPITQLPKLSKTPISTGQLVNAPGTTRARYLGLKKKVVETLKNRKITKGEAFAELRADREFKRSKKWKKKLEAARKVRDKAYPTIMKQRAARRQARAAAESVTAA